jgi:hypothetical protein
MRSLHSKPRAHGGHKITTLRCFAEGQKDRWEAICLEFDIAVQGRSLEEVFHSLNAAIDMYVESVMALPEAERAEFLNRRAPLALRLRFLEHVVGAILFGQNPKNGTTWADFLIPCGT